MKKAIKIFFVLCVVLSVYIFAAIYIMSGNVSPNYKIIKGETLKIKGIAPVTAVYKGSKIPKNQVGDTYEVDLKIFGVIPFSTANVEVVDDMHVSVLGNPFGMKIYTNGVLVVESEDINTDKGTVNPAISAGIRVGDYIKKANGKKVTCNEDLLQIVSDSNGKAVKFNVIRNSKEFTCSVQPVLDSDSGAYRIGIWVRDSSAGIGTLTFYSPTAGVVCGLGHGICDTDTETLLQIEKGEMVEADIVSVDKGADGSPGSLKGKLSYNSIADITINSDKGVYGIINKKMIAPNLTKVALKQQVKNGDAQILCTVDGNTPKLYSCKIKKNGVKNAPTKNLIVTITDPELIAATGGIVQGMSGSPILQDGCLIGALTHVLVSDSKTGYGIYAENMLETAKGVEQSKNLKNVG